MTVEPWLVRAAAARPDAVALELQAPGGTATHEITYAELLSRARAAAADLVALGARPGDRVALALRAGLDFAVLLHACFLAEAVAVPVDLRLGATERERVSTGAAIAAEEGARGGGGCSISGCNARARVRARSAPDHDNDDGAHDNGARPRALGSLDALAVLIHTSGTSARPKPVALTHGNFLWSAIGSAVALGVDRDERWLCTLPLSHVGGLSILVRSAIYATTAIVHERFDAARALAALRDGRVTLVSLVATTLERLLDAGCERPRHLRCALVGGGPVPPALVARARAAGVPVSVTYGMSEACSQVATQPLAETLAAAREDGESGARPLFCTRVRTDAATGEVLVAGPTVAPGSVGAGGWLRTGDVGRVDARGRLHIEGRRSETIISGGENVAPAEVEAVLQGHPGVREAAVVGRPDGRWGEAVIALVVRAPGAEVGADALRSHCAERLAPFKVPKAIELVPGPLPRTAAGKLLRRALREGRERESVR